MKNIIRAYAHDVLFDKGLGNIDKNLDTSPDKPGTIKVTKMTLLGDTLLEVEAYNVAKNVKTKMLVPVTNFKLLVEGE